MKNKKRFGFLSAVMGLCLSATSIFGTTAFATEGEGAGEQPVVYAAQSDIVDIVFAKNKVDYFTANDKVVDLTSKDNANLTIRVELGGNVLASGVDYSYSAGSIVYGETDDYSVVLVNNNGTAEASDDIDLATATVKVVNSTDISNNADYQVKYAVENDALTLFNAAIATNVNKVINDKLVSTSTSVEIPKSFWDLLDLGVFESSQLVTKVYLAKPKTDFSVVNSSWKSDLSKLSLSGYGTYAFYVEIKDFYGNQVVVDKETMELRTDGWYLKDTDTRVIPVFSFDYIKEVVPSIEISAKQRTGIIGVEYNSGRLTTENVAKTTITLYYNENPNATITGETAEERVAALSANGWKVATAEQATISGGTLTSSSLKFTPLVKGAFAYKVVAIGSDVDNQTIADASGAISVTQAVQAQKLVNVKFRNFLKTNWLSLVFLGIAFLCVVGIIVLAFYKPKDAEEIAAKKAKKAKVEDAEEVEETEDAEEAEEVVETEEVEEVEETEETEETEEAVETEEVVEAPADEEKPE